MMMRIKKLGGWICLLVALCIALAGCSSNGHESANTNNSAEQKETSAKSVPNNLELVVFHVDKEYLTDEPERGDLINDINALLAQRGIQASVAVDASERADFAAIPDGVDVVRIVSINAYRAYVSDNRLMGLTEELAERPNLYDLNPSSVWNDVDDEKSIYAFPLVDESIESTLASSSLIVRRDVLEALGAEAPTTWEELTALSIMARDNGLDYQIVYPYAFPPYALHRTYDNWPFYVDIQSVALYDMDGGVYSYPHSDVYTSDAQLLGKLFDEGLLEVLPTEKVETFKGSGDHFFAAMFPIIRLAQSSPYFDQVAYVQLAPDKPSFPLLPTYTSMLCVPASAGEERLSAIMDVLEAIYTDIDIYNAFQSLTRLYRHENSAPSESIGIPFLSADPSIADIIQFPASQFQPRSPKEIIGVLTQLSTGNGLFVIRAGMESSINTEENLRLLEQKGMDIIIDDYQKQYDEYLVHQHTYQEK